MPKSLKEECVYAAASRSYVCNKNSISIRSAAAHTVLSGTER